MSHAPQPPLTPEERALADRLARLGPHGGPSPALDARILAAAHAAGARPPRRRRWWALTGVPASLVTGAGMAAALALVVGVVWQLRPSPPPLQAPREEAADMGYVSAEVIERPQPAVAAAPPPPPPAQTMPAPERALRAPSPSKPPAKPAAAPRSLAATAPAPETARDAVAAESVLDEAVVDAPAPAAPAGYLKRSAATAASAPPPPSPPAPAAAAAASAVMASPSAAEPTGNTAAMAHRETRAAAEAAAPALDRIEVTGSRLRASDLPIQDDARLAPVDWLERIRARRDAGELDDAHASLVLFRRTHPHAHLPDDLRPLLVAPR